MSFQLFFFFFLKIFAIEILFKNSGDAKEVNVKLSLNETTSLMTRGFIITDKVTFDISMYALCLMI